MKTLGEEEAGGKCLFIEAEFGGGVSEGAVLHAVVAVPAACGVTVGIIASEA